MFYGGNVLEALIDKMLESGLKIRNLESVNSDDEELRLRVIILEIMKCDCR